MQLTLLLVIAALTTSATEAHQQEVVEVIKAGYGETCPSEEVRQEARRNITTRVKGIISTIGSYNYNCSMQYK